ETEVLKIKWQFVSGVIPYIEYRGDEPWNASSFDVLSFRAAWTDWVDEDGDIALSCEADAYLDLQWFVVEIESNGCSRAVDVGKYGGVPQRYPNWVRIHQSHDQHDVYNIMNTVRVPLASFVMSGDSCVELSHVDAVRIYFNFPQNGEIFLDDLEFSK
ncbi:hypothetical protein ACFL51_01540, partial [Myxococcota bacterium]